KTECREDYVVAFCKEYEEPKTDTNAAPAGAEPTGGAAGPDPTGGAAGADPTGGAAGGGAAGAGGETVTVP
ncbi:MAG: hypothetical protein AB7G37_09935, partial [Solirubrobacteraceae bacterium]